jgi:X-X-X-Leu-X-X-Gly heptad repeat protein
MHNAGDLAALVAAFFFAVLVCAGVYVLIRLARLISEGTRLVADMRSRSDTVFERVQAAVDRANQQLDATSTVTAGMDELNAGMSQLTDQVSALAGLGQAISAGPAGRAGAFVYGVRRAVAIRRAGTVRPERAVAPAADPATPSAAQPVAQQAAQPVAQQAARPVAQQSAQPVAQPAVQPVAQEGDGAAAGGPPRAAVASRRSLAPSGGRR